MDTTRFGVVEEEAVYGLTEVLRDEIRNARLVANPGCYPTSIQLPLVPLIKAKLIKLSNIIIDAKSGVTGAGRGAKEANIYTKIAEGIHAHGIKGHLHVPEVEQRLSDAAESKSYYQLHPNLICMKRWMQCTMFVEMAPGVTIDNLVNGASGQAVQNFNLMMGMPENTGLQYQPLFP